jgi:hypothetical protein
MKQENLEETKGRRTRSFCRGPVQGEGRSFPGQAGVYPKGPQHPQGAHIEHEGVSQSLCGGFVG